ncbi:hypothetical protein SETIT_2G298500v2 [Setaria italica]|uniref:Uncharacterized protein n=1 Tax=Setaria italica TaxID=4555 RepID=A0A368Q464_SETIT|nr:uncharacterized protein LOC101776689 [Setaria italica]XP_022679607.1 uncharacterized protein LOC101776689 [Setaria italica]RCV12817.1 hypothetical protein SETIT_2G298500v2 [Setaria italica]
MPAGDNPHSISEKKAALRESPKRTKNVVNEQPGTSFSKDKVAATVGLKRPQPYGPLSPTNHHTLGNPGANGHLVYVRRRPDTDQSKGGTSARAESFNSISTKKPVAGGSQPQESSLKHQNNVPHTQSSPQFASPAAVTASPALQSTVLLAQHSFGKQSPGKITVRPTNDVITSLPPSNMVSSTPMLQSSAAADLVTSSVLATSATSTLAPDRADPPRSSNQDWSDRFIQLQAFLRNNEQSGKEEYIRSKQSPGKVAVRPTNGVTTSLSPRNVMSSTPVPQSSVAANLAHSGVSSATNAASRAAISAANLVSSSVSATTAASNNAISATNLAPNRAHPPRSSNQDRSDRFLQLQTFLRNNEQSGQEEYIRMLRSLSSVGLSKHAIELEKRAANLLVEEGKELQKMKVLNVLGKLSPTDAPQFPAQPATVKHLPFPARR